MPGHKNEDKFVKAIRKAQEDKSPLELMESLKFLLDPIDVSYVINKIKNDTQ